MRRSAEAQSFLDTLVRAAALRCSAAAHGLNGERCSGKKRSKKLQLFSLIYEEKTDFQAFSTRFLQHFFVPLQRFCF
jgi:hypothetical protein